MKPWFGRLIRGHFESGVSGTIQVVPNEWIQETAMEPSHIRRRRLGVFGLLAFVIPFARAAGAAPEVEVWKSPTCGCCGDWVEHLRANGFKVKVNQVDDVALWRQRLGMPDRYGSCHTARVAGYTLEGHVPAADVRRLLAGKPAAVGLAVPGMPIGSPGMDAPVYAGRKDPFDVLLVRGDGSADVFNRYPKGSNR